MTNVTGELAAALVKRHLCGLPGDPQVTEAYDRLNSIVSEMALNVDHARTALESFQDGFPSPRELRDSLYNIKERFEDPKPRPPKPDTEFRDQVLETLRGSTFGAQLQELKVSAVRDMLYYTEGAGRNEPHDRAYWTAARIRDLRAYPALVAALREGRTPTAEEIGITPTRLERVSAIVERAVTETDVETARQKYEAEKEKARAEIARDQAAREMNDADRAGRQQAGDYTANDPERWE